MEGVEQTLVKWSNECEKTQFDFLLIGGTGLSAQKEERYFMGKVVTHMLRKTVLNVVVVPGGE